MKTEAWLKFDMDKLTVQLAIMRSVDGQVLVDNDSLGAMLYGGSYVPKRGDDANRDGWTITEQLAHELLTTNGFRKWDERES